MGALARRFNYQDSHAVMDSDGNPIALKLTESQAHDGRSPAGLLDSVVAGQILLADRGGCPDPRVDLFESRLSFSTVQLV